MNYIHLYNNLIELTRNKDLYQDFNKQDEFSDRLVFFLVHLAFFFKAFKSKENLTTLQKIYDFIFRQLELSIREIGYGDQSINKKMKDYLNLFHGLIDKIHFWEEKEFKEKIEILDIFMDKPKNKDFLVEYFDKYFDKLKNNTLNSYLKSVVKA